MTKQINTAVLFLVFNRPNLTKRVFEVISEVKPPRLYIACDGPRPDRPGEVELVQQVRSIATKINWVCQVNTLYQDKNIGCQFGPRKGIDWFFSQEAEGIILEDDCLPNTSFFYFCEQMLIRYRKDERFMAISGTNIFPKLNTDGDYFVSKYPLMWGWATWARAWSKYDPDINSWSDQRKSRWLETLDLGGLSFRLTWQEIFDKTNLLKEKATWWDYQWIYSCWVSNGWSIIPSRNLVSNIGFQESATHTFKIDPYRSNLKRYNLYPPYTEPNSLMPDKEADIYVSKYWFQARWSKIILRVVLNLNFIKKARTIIKKFITV